jgi:hypothetical protein
MVLFAEIPDAMSLAGIGIIVAAGVYMLHHQAMRRRTPATVAGIDPPH